MKSRVLIADDDRSMCEMLEHDLKRRGFEVSWRLSAEDAFSVVLERDVDVLLADINMPGMDGIALCERVAANRPDVPVIVITAFGSMDTAVSAIRAGAYDFVTKPVDLDVLALVIERAARHRELTERVRILSEEVERSRGVSGLVGESPSIRSLVDTIARVADADTSVLITGESGTGKELVARLLHKQSRRKEGAFVPVNCAAIPDTLLESELFGHRAGSFTDARADRRGLFVEASGGVLFLDEVGEIPLALQPKLLRALEQRKVRPVGANEEIEFDVRVLAATNRDLESEMDARRFREDLYYRLNVIQIEVPPLRARGSDILRLARHFVDEIVERSGKQVTGISRAAAERLLEYAWPGNVRELRNAMERAVALTRFDEIAVEDLPEKIRSYRGSHVVVGGDDPTEFITLEALERRYVEHVLKTAGDNKSLAARILGLDRKTLYRKLRRYKGD